MRALLIIAPAILVLACQRDPGRDVRPMADPLRTDTAASDAPVEIIPLDQSSECVPSHMPARRLAEFVAGTHRFR